MKDWLPQVAGMVLYFATLTGAIWFIYWVASQPTTCTP